MRGEHALRSLLRRVRQRWFLLEWSRVLTWTAAAAAAAVCAAALTARLARVEGGGLLALAGAVAVVTCAAFSIAAWPLRRRPGDRQVARFVEERCPELEDRIASASVLLDRTDRSAFDALVLEDAAAHARALDLERVVPSQAIVRRGFEATLAIAALMAVLGGFRTPAGQALWTLRYTLFPPDVALRVEPGDIHIVEGDDVTVRARLLGVPRGWQVESPVLTTTTGGHRRQMVLPAVADAFELELVGVRSSTRYRVNAGRLASREFSIDVRRPPRVARIDLTYAYPAFTGLPPRVEEDGGDIFGPAGTRVRLRVRGDRPVAAGEIVLADGRQVALAPGPAGTLEGELSIASEGSYRVAVRDAEGLASRGDTEYFIRVMDDRPPDVRLLRPAGDRRVTAIEEVVFEARADDDYGVERLDLVVAVRGDSERVVRLHRGPAATSVSGEYTLFLENLGVQPGDFVSYYARARDVGRGKRSTEARSDIFFLEVRPFTEEFEAAQSQAFMGAGGNFDDLAAQQKEVVIATWKLERRAAAGRSRSDVGAVARAQAEVRRRAERLAQRIDVRSSIPPRPDGPDGRRGLGAAPQARAGAMQRAVEAMGRAQKALEAVDTRAAIPHEMEALNELLRAQAEVRRTQVAQQQSNGGGRGGPSGNQDLSALFDRELQRQQTNYENRSTASDAGAGRDGNDPLEKLRELARRQDDLSRRQQDLERRRGEMTPEEVRRQLERLTREQLELRRRAEQLARSLSQQGEQAATEPKGEESASAGQALRDAAQEMRRAAGELQQGNAGAAGGRGRRVVDRLQDAERQASARQPDERRRAAGEAQLGLDQLAQAQRRLARDAASAEGGETWRRIAAEQDRLADRAERVARNVRELSAGSPAGDPMRQAARALDRQGLDERMRSSARGMREAARGESASDEARQQLGSDAARIADALERAARGLSSASGRDPDAQRLSERLARAREARERLAEVERRIEQATGERRGEQAADRADHRAHVPGGESPGQGSTTAGRMQELQQEYARRLAEARQALSDARGELPEFAEGFSTPTDWQPSRSAPGTEAFKQDFARWDELRRGVAGALERVEAVLSAKLNELESRGRLAADADDGAPESYRRQIARYYETITKKDRP